MTSESLIRKASSSDLQLIKNLWLEHFTEDSKEYVNFYFENMYKEENTYILEQNGELLCTLQVRPKKLLINKEVINTNLIIAVVTPEKHRRQGHMNTLLEYVFDDIEKHGDITLIQAYNWDVYRKYGFRDSHFLNQCKLNLKKYETKSTIIETTPERMVELYNKFAFKYDGYELRDISYYKEKIALSEITKTKFIVSENCYIEVMGNEIIDYAFKDIEDLFASASHIKGELSIMLPINIQPENKFIKVIDKKLFMQMRNVNDNIFKDKNKVFINEYI